MDRLFQILAALPSPVPQVHVIVDNLPSGQDALYNDALIAIASVAAVLWTGGLIIRQLFPSHVTIQVQNGMAYVMFSAFSSIGALFVHGNVLRIAAGCFFAWYVWLGLRGLWEYRVQRRDPTKIPPVITNKESYFKAYRLSMIMTSCLLVAYLPIFAFPNAYGVAWTAFFVLFAGYQLILTHLSQARPQVDAQAAGILTISGALQRILEILAKWDQRAP